MIRLLLVAAAAVALSSCAQVTITGSGNSVMVSGSVNGNSATIPTGLPGLP
jgi:hypothetical protein